MAIKNVALLGANGNLGPAIIKALVKHNFTVTVLKRASSKSSSEYGPGIKVETIDDTFPTDALVPILTGQDALIVTAKSPVDLQKRLADAAVQTGVRRLIPADFGSVDSSSAHSQDCVPLFKNKTELRDHLIGLTERNPGFSWSSIVCGHFFDWDLAFLHLYPDQKRADIVDDGDLKASYSTLGQVGEATARILMKPEETKNKVLFIQSFCVTLNEILGSFEKATGAKWEVNRVDSAAYEKQEKAKRDQGDKEAIENLVWLLGAIEGNWEVRDQFAMGLLGLQNEDLDQVVTRIVKERS